MTRSIMALVVLALALPVMAQAQAPTTNAPPGNSAIDEYLETVPGASGSKPARPQGERSRGERAGSGALNAAERARLERLGPDGRTLADAVDATAGAADRAAASRKRTSEKAQPVGGSGRSPAREVLDTLAGDDGGSGMGLILPAILIAALLAAITLVLLRRRAAS